MSLHLLFSKFYFRNTLITMKVEIYTGEVAMEIKIRSRHLKFMTKEMLAQSLH